MVGNDSIRVGGGVVMVMVTNEFSLTTPPPWYYIKSPLNTFTLYGLRLELILSGGVMVTIVYKYKWILFKYLPHSPAWIK